MTLRLAMEALLAAANVAQKAIVIVAVDLSDQRTTDVLSNCLDPTGVHEVLVAGHDIFHQQHPGPQGPHQCKNPSN